MERDKVKISARERIINLLDKDSFLEIGELAKLRTKTSNLKDISGDGIITGFGTISGKPVVVASQDFTVLGGTVGAIHAQKLSRAIEFAADKGFPFIFFIESGGARIQEGVEALEGFSKIFAKIIKASGIIPQIAIASGACAGGAAYSGVLADFLIFVKEATMFVNGPAVISELTGEITNVQTLGGAKVHTTKSGVAHFYAEDLANAIKITKDLLEFLPANAFEFPRTEQGEGLRKVPEIEKIIKQKDGIYDIKKVINSIVDYHKFLEVQPFFAENIVVGFGRIGGNTFGIIANQPLVLEGYLDSNASIKASRFIRFCDSFNIPLLTLVDVPGFLPGVEQEEKGILRHGAKLLYAYGEATVPKITVILGKAYGGGYIAMCSKNLGADVTLALPTAKIGVMEAKAAANILFAGQKEAKMKEKEILNYYDNPNNAAIKGVVDIIIKPEDLRNKIIYATKFLNNLKNKTKVKKHGNLPL
ncbi:acyl-CoA carboxylase subunit beta [Carboxydothermus pertinax]|uniref:Methylmalonyl-CoA carboxyltransferase n=1 Tax=Carboxydothermus pertinax TaxID=870242 RepID=A0A1L8CSF5_9THEO|nr:acyl-CoA carboxylase subunit beta [Carboxydothermus pertinax]GAV21827.1 methylmalonyl-CoA carboxyltransferase [Carboxydothermus pertinax]